MSGVDLEKQNGRRALVGLTKAIRKLSTAPKTSARLITKTQAAKRLGISPLELWLRIASGEIDTVKFGRRELVLFY